MKQAPVAALAMLAALAGCQRAEQAGLPPAASPLPQAASERPATTATAEATRPQRIVSLNLCTDQILLQLVERSRIAALSRLAADPASSMLAEAARGIPSVRGSAEEVLALQPDLVLVGTHTTLHTTQMLRRFGIPVLAVPGADGFADAQAQILLVARSTGDEARGQQLVQRMQAAQQALAASVAAENPNAVQRPTAALYGANGHSAGAGTIYDDMLGLAGWRNAAAEAGVPGYGQLPLERLVAQRPELLLVPRWGHNALGAQRPLQHPVLAELGVQRLELPSRMTVCGGPWNIAAAERLAQARRANASSLPHPHPITP
ncbi:ABC transporter substrate-binding protein [Vandammella animalimorsus]|uniref:ABC transporter substrate-binding protein n=1 Tax=Vandammella animalimorsus TaxID=2029117 RepID=UPI0031BB763F